MIPRKAILLPLITGAILLAVFWATPTTPTYSQGPAPDYACKGCHVGNDKEITLPSGETVLAGVKTDTLEHSVHGTETETPIYCTDCHPKVRYQYPHPPNPAQTQQEFAAGVAQSCQRCHNSLQKHNPGHLMAQDNPNLPTCTDCHAGGHAIEPVDSMAVDPVATCQECHQSFEEPKVEAIHQQLAKNLGDDQTCQSCHSDQPVYPADQMCKSCHGLLTDELVLESGEAIPLNVNATLLENSVHGIHLTEKLDYTPMLCVDCHRNKTHYQFPHQPLETTNFREFTLEKSEMCRECHEDVYEKAQDSTHAAALTEGNMDAANCIDCHGNHDVQSPNDPRERISQVCGQCHKEINEEYAASVHGAALLGEHNPDVPVCTDCHGVHNINDPTTALFRVRSPQLCGNCHANEEMMGRYDISTNVFDSYVADFHGTTVELFEKQSPDQETNKAVCYDCHGVHNILPATDEHSQVIKDNLLITCQQCHPDATANFSNAWTSHFEPSLEHNTLIYLVNLFYQILIPVTIGGFTLFIATDLYRRVTYRWRAK